MKPCLTLVWYLDSYVRIALMSSSGFEMTKSKTSVRRGQPNPTFKETFIFQVNKNESHCLTLHMYL